MIVPDKGKSDNKTISSVFGNSDDSSEDDGRRVGMLGPGEAQKRQARLVQAKALEEDPTVFQYDELYDDMDTKRKEERATKVKAVDRKPKYIGKLMVTAERRKKELERQIERQVQKERDEEGEKFKDKESFVTSSYKKKLEEMRLAEEEEKREEYLESIGNVQNQGNLDGFYRHLYEQKLGEPKPAQAEAQDKKERQYRKRHSSEEPEEEVSVKEPKDVPDVKSHLQSNLDADSDFSIDSSDTDDDEGGPIEGPETKVESTVAAEDKLISPIPNVKEKSPPAVVKEVVEESLAVEATVAVEEPKPKIDIWAKRTVGDAFDEALGRYYARKSVKAGV